MKKPKKLKFRIVKNKDKRPYERSIKYGDTIVFHIPDYLDILVIAQLLAILNSNPKLTLNLYLD